MNLNFDGPRQENESDGSIPQDQRCILRYETEPKVACFVQIVLGKACLARRRPFTLPRTQIRISRETLYKELCAGTFLERLGVSSSDFFETWQLSVGYPLISNESHGCCQPREKISIAKQAQPCPI
jgi:hypothetical protein